MVKILAFLVVTLLSGGLMIYFESLAIVYNNTHPSRAWGWELLVWLLLAITVWLAYRTFCVFNQPKPPPKHSNKILPGNRIFWVN